MSCQALEDLQYIEGDIQSDLAYSPPPIPNQNPHYTSPNTDNFMGLTSCNATKNNPLDYQNPYCQQQIELNSSSYMNDHQTHQMLNQNPQHYQEARSESTSSIPLSNRQYSPSNKQYYQQLTPPYNNVNKNYIVDDHSDSLNKSSNTKTNKRDDLIEFELLEQQPIEINDKIQTLRKQPTLSVQKKNQLTLLLKSQDIFKLCQHQKFSTRDNILSNNTDYTAQEILNAAATPIPSVSQTGDKKIKMKPTLKKNYMSLEQLQIKCQMSTQNDNQINHKSIKNDQYGDNVNSQEFKNDIYNNQKGNYNTMKSNTVSDTVDQSDIFNKYNLANSEFIDQQADSLQQLLERAFKSKQKYDQASNSQQNVPQPITKPPPPPIQLEKQILSTLPPPSPINIQNQYIQNMNNLQKQNGKEQASKIQLQFSNILESLKKTNSTTTIVSSHTTESKSNSQQNCSNLQSKSGNKTPTSASTTLLYQNEVNDKILVERQYDPNSTKNTYHSNSRQLGKVYASLGEFENQGPSQKQTTMKTQLPLMGKSQSHANLKIQSNQQRSISLSTAQDYARILNRRRSSSRRMSSKGSIGSVDSKGKPTDLIQKEIKELNAFFSNLEQEKNEYEDGDQFARSMSNKKIPLKSASSLLLRLNQDLERRRVIQQEQLKQKEIKSKLNIEEFKKQNISRGKLSKDEEKNLVNKLFDDANRRQNIQVMQQKMKRIEEEQREKSVEVQRESIMKKTNSTHNSSLYANVQSKIKSIIESKPVKTNDEDDETTSHSQNRNSVTKHSYSKKNQNRTISPILKRTQKPLQTSDSQTHLNKTQLALQQFQHNEKLDDQYRVQVKIQQNGGQTAQKGHHQQTKSTTFMDNLQFQFYTPAKPLTKENIGTTNKTLSKELDGTKSTKQLLNNSNSSKQSYLKQLSFQKYKADKKSTLDGLSIPTTQNHKERSTESHNQLYINQNGAPPSISTIKKHLSSMKSNLRSSQDNVHQQKKLTKNDSFINKENGQNSKSLSRKPMITISIDEDEQQNNSVQQSNQINGLRHLQSITPSSINQNHQNSSQHNSSIQNPSYVSMKCTNSYFREKNPSTLATTNQNFLKINRQMQYQYTSAAQGNQTSKNSSVNQSQQQSMKNSNLFPCKTPNNQNNGLNSNNKKSTFSFINQSETSMDDQQFFHSKQNTTDRIKINIAQNRAQILESNFPTKQKDFITEPQQQNNQQESPQKKEKLENINKFITENPNFIQFMIEQFNLIQSNNNFNPQQVQQMQMNPMRDMDNFSSFQQQQMQQYYNLMNNPNQQINNKPNKILTVDDLLELGTYNNEASQVPLQNSPEIPQKNFPYKQEDQQKQQYQLISMQEIDQTPINLLQYYEQNNSYMTQQQMFQPQNSYLNYQIQNSLQEDQTGKSFGSFQNLGNSGQKLGQNLQISTLNNQNMYQFKSGNSIEYQDNELLEQNFQSISNLNPMTKSQITIPSSNCIGNNISSNSTIEQHFNNLTYLQQKSNQFIQYNN